MVLALRRIAPAGSAGPVRHKAQVARAAIRRTDRQMCSPPGQVRVERVCGGLRGRARCCRPPRGVYPRGNVLPAEGYCADGVDSA